MRTLLAALSAGAAALVLGLAGRAATPVRWIVFSATPPGEHVDQLYRIQSSGGGLQQLTKGAYPSDDPSFSPNGTRIAFARGGVGILTMNPDGSGLHRVTTNGRDSFPAWSPDGKRIAFVRPVGTKWRVYVASSAGDAPRRLAQAPPAGRPSWTKAGLLVPSGGDLLRIDDRTGHVLKYYGANIDAIWGLNTVAVAPDRTRLTYVGARAPEPGDMECGEGPCQRFGLYLESLTTKRKKPQMIVKDAGPAGFSPDGRQLAFTDGGKLVLRTLGGGSTALATGGAYPTNAAPPAWQ